MNKRPWHQLNLDFTKRQGFRKGQLRGSYFEVVDANTPQSYDLLVVDPVTRCLPAKGFIAVNDKPKAITGHPLDPPYSLFCEDAFKLAVRLSRMTAEKLAAVQIPAPIVAYNFDMQQNADPDSEFWSLHWEQLYEIALNTYKAQNLCIVILNMALHPRFLHRQNVLLSQAVEHHAVKVLETFRGLPVQGLTLASLIGNSSRAFDGRLDIEGKKSGAFQVYRKTEVPMVTLRLSFGRGQALCGFAPPLTSMVIPRMLVRSMTI